MTRKATRAADTHCIMSEIVLPNDTNSLGNLMGGRLLHWMDICAAISSQRHAGCVCVTVGVDEVEFRSEIQKGEIVVLESQVNRAFHTSMEVEINVWAENPREQTRRKCNRAFFTFVAIGEDGKPRSIPELETSTDEEQRRFENAGRRRELRLFRSGRIGPEDAPNLAAYLNAFRKD
jgi:acyl-CoA hydrolase